MTGIPLIAAGEAASAAFGPLDFALAGSLLFWGLACFLIYYFGLAPIMMRRSEALIDDRDQTIKGDLAAAEAANSKAADVLAQYENKLEEARAEASATVRSVILESEKKSLAAENQIAKKISEDANESDIQIAKTLQEAAQDLADCAAETAQMAVNHVAGIKVTKAVARKAVGVSN